MATLYVRTLNLKDSLSDAEVVETWRYILDEVIPAIDKVPGTQSVKLYSGAGALRADIMFLWEMEDAGVYERALVDAEVRKHLGRTYGTWDMASATQSFRREVTSDLIKALTSTG